MSKANSRSLPDTNAATIVRAHQKDVYFESSLKAQLQDVLSIVKGQRFINMNPEEISVAAKALYLILTTFLGARTLGEEYADILYVNRKGNRLPSLLSRGLFIASYAILPYIITRAVRRFKSEDKGWLSTFASSYSKVLDVTLHLHVAIFYFTGRYYALSKRIFGMRYVFGHNKDPKKQIHGNYSFLGIVMILQFTVNYLIRLKGYFESKKQKDHEQDDTDSNCFKKVTQLEALANKVNNDSALNESLSIDLSNPKHLPYLPENARSCMLCLSPMLNPSAATCGHIFCWTCIVDWLRQNPECPLCRQSCLEQNLLPLQ